MTTIPEACLAYTKVFTTLKLELAVAVGIGVLIGYIFKSKE